MLPGEDLPEAWRFTASTLRDMGAEGQAATLELCARALEGSIRAWETEALPLLAASEESGYSAEHLGRLVRDGQIPNAGVPGSPLIRRLDLPRKPGAGSDGSSRIEAVGSAEQVVRSVLSNGGQE